VLCAAASVPAALWLSTTERAVQAAADAILPELTADDLVIIDSRLAPREDPGGLIRPFAPFATLVLQPTDALPDLTTLPHKRVFLVGDEWAPFAGPQARHVGPRTSLVAIAHAGEPIVSLMDSLQVSVEQNGVVRGCMQRHPSGGVRCAGQPWQYVGPAVVQANGKRIACLWTHPVHQHRLHIDVPITPPVRANLWLQYADEALNDSPHPDIVFNAFLDGVLAQSSTCANRKPGRCGLDVDVDVVASSLKLTIETADAARQLICLGGELVQR
jgi:hypothetical protein